MTSYIGNVSLEFLGRIHDRIDVGFVSVYNLISVVSVFNFEINGYNASQTAESLKEILIIMDRLCQIVIPRKLYSPKRSEVNFL